MNRVALAFSTKDRVELSERTVAPLLDAPCAVYWIDGSSTEAGRALPLRYADRCAGVQANVRGGADAAIVFGLTHLLAQPENYTHVGLVENDVLLTDSTWFERTMTLFDLGARDGIVVGAASARCYEDRVLIQRPDYAVMHNLGAGMVIFTREAAEIVLRNFRTGWTDANRLLFSQLSGVDVGGYWAFGGGSHPITADWHFDAVLAAHGLASLALTPSPVEMIGQDPPLAEQGLVLATGPVAARVDAGAAARYVSRLCLIRDGAWSPAFDSLLQCNEQDATIFPHQLPYVGGYYNGDWVLRWSQGWGPFDWRVNTVDSCEVPSSSFVAPVVGPCEILIGGGERGGRVRVVDQQSGFSCEPEIRPESFGTTFALTVPGSYAWRNVEVTILSPGLTFYGLHCRLPQPTFRKLSFNHAWLPPVG